MVRFDSNLESDDMHDNNDRDDNVDNVFFMLIILYNDHGDFRKNGAKVY